MLVTKFSYFTLILLESAASNSHSRVSMPRRADRKSTRLNSSHSQISYAVFCLKKKKKKKHNSFYIHIHNVKYMLNNVIAIISITYKHHSYDSSIFTAQQFYARSVPSVDVTNLY